MFHALLRGKNTSKTNALYPRAAISAQIHKEGARIRLRAPARANMVRRIHRVMVFERGVSRFFAFLIR